MSDERKLTEEHLITDQKEREKKAVAPTTPLHLKSHGVKRVKSQKKPKRTYVMKHDEIGWQLRMYRKQCDISVNQLAKKAEVSADNLHKFENGEVTISLHNLQKVLRKMDLKLAITPA